MELEKIKNKMYIELESLFAHATTSELVGDTDGYTKSLNQISQIAYLLNISTVIKVISIDLK